MSLHAHKQGGEPIVDTAPVLAESSASIEPAGNAKRAWPLGLRHWCLRRKTGLDTDVKWHRKK